MKAQQQQTASSINEEMNYKEVKKSFITMGF